VSAHLAYQPFVVVMVVPVLSLYPYTQRCPLN
jgi:hypothetical protein